MKEYSRRRSTRNSKQNAVSTPLETARSRSASANENTPNRKRKRNASSSVEGTRAPKRIVDGRVVDQYCWVCHKFGSESICNSCPRVYHKDCLRKLKGNSNLLFSCECYMKRVDGKDESLGLNKEELEKLLQFALQEAVEGKNHKQRSRKAEHAKFMQLLHFQTAESEALCSSMDISILIDRMNGEKVFSSTGQCFLDIKWLYHNCCILYGSDNEITEAALTLEKNFKLELLDLEACSSCYLNRNLKNGFTQVCKNNHEVIWAKLRGSPYWPAKLLNVYNGHADVRFFGTHDKANIKIKHCFKLSREPPLRKTIHQPKYIEAVEERDIYLANYFAKTKVNLPYFRVNTPLDTGNARAKKGRKGRHRSHRDEQVLRNESSAGSSGSGTREGTSEHPIEKEVKCVRNFFDKGGNQDMTDSVEGIDSTDPKVMYSLTFSSDEHDGSASENNTDEFDSALLQAPYNPDLYSATSFLPSSNNYGTDIETGQNSVDFLNANALCIMTPVVSSNDIPLVPVLSSVSGNAISSNTVSADLGSLPVITSASSACENIAFSHENLGVSETLPHTDNSAPLSSVTDHLMKLINEAKENYALEDDQDEIEVLNEERKTSPVHHILKNPAVLKTLTQFLIGTKPQIKEQLHKFHTHILRTFLSLWIETSSSRFGNNEMRKYVELVSRFVKTIENQKKAIFELEEERDVLRDKVSKIPSLKKLVEDIATQKTKTEIGIIKEQHRISEEQLNQEILSLKMQLQKIQRQDADITELTRKSNQHKEYLQNNVQHKTTQTENPQSEDEDSDQLIGSDHESGNESSDSQQLPDFTHIQVQQREVVIMQTNMSSIPLNSALNLSAVQQPYDGNYLMRDCGMLITPPTADMMAIAPVAVVTPVVQGPSFLGVDNSSNYLNSGNTTKSEDNQAKTSSGKRRKNNT